MTAAVRVPAVPFIRVPRMALTRVSTMSLSTVPRPLEIIQCLLIRVVLARQFPFIEIIRRIGIAEFRILFHILFRLIVRVFRLGVGVFRLILRA